MAVLKEIGIVHLVWLEHSSEKQVRKVAGGIRKAGTAPQIAFFRPLICAGARRNPAACGTNQGNLNRWFDPLGAEGGGGVPSLASGLLPPEASFESVLKTGCKNIKSTLP